MTDRSFSLLLPALLLSLAQAFAQSAGADRDSALAQARSLVAEGRYASAYKLLDSADPGNLDPRLAVAKLDILLRDSASNLTDRSFALADLKPGQRLSDLKAGSADLELVPFDAEAVFGALISREPDDRQLYRALGDFYLDARIHFGDSWRKGGPPVSALALDNYRKAARLGAQDPPFLAHAGLAAIFAGDFAEAAGYYRRELDGISSAAPPDDLYNLAYALSRTGDAAAALPYALQASRGYRGAAPGKEADALRLASDAYAKTGDAARAIASCEEILALIPDDTGALERLVALRLAGGEVQGAGSAARRLFAVFPADPAIGKFLLDAYLASKRPRELFSLLEGLRAAYSADDAASGNILYFEGVLLDRAGYPERAVESLAAAKLRLEKAYPGNPAVFSGIDEMIAGIKREAKPSESR